jgi:Cd(II)/Pb(II)-responsive transcriptional regulator
MKIGELARRAGVEVETVRYYERDGLLEAPPRTPSGYRAYGPRDLERLNFVRHCRSLDMPLAEIKRVLDLSRHAQVPCEAVDRLVSAHLERVRAKLAALQSLESQLASLRGRCASGHRVADCGILAELVHAAQGAACACHSRA